MEWLLVLGIGYLFWKGPQAAAHAATPNVPAPSPLVTTVPAPSPLVTTVPASTPPVQPTETSAQDLAQYEIQATNIATSGLSVDEQTAQLQALYDQAKVDPVLSPSDLQNLWNYMLGVVS
jgi:hypothetical protein